MVATSLRSQHRRNTGPYSRDRRRRARQVSSNRLWKENACSFCDASPVGRQRIGGSHQRVVPTVCPPVLCVIESPLFWFPPAPKVCSFHSSSASSMGLPTSCCRLVTCHPQKLPQKSSLREERERVLEENPQVQVREAVHELFLINVATFIPTHSFVRLLVFGFCLSTSSSAFDSWMIRMMRFKNVLLRDDMGHLSASDLRGRTLQSCLFGTATCSGTTAQLETLLSTCRGRSLKQKRGHCRFERGLEV